MRIKTVGQTLEKARSERSRLLAALVEGVQEHAADNSIFTTSAIPLPWPTGFRPETLRPPLSVEFALFGSYNIFIGLFAENLKNLFVLVRFARLYTAEVLI